MANSNVAQAPKRINWSGSRGSASTADGVTIHHSGLSPHSTAIPQAREFARRARVRDAGIIGQYVVARGGRVIGTLDHDADEARRCEVAPWLEREPA